MQEENSRKPDEKTYELAICFARMWGIAETLEPLHHISFEEVRDKVVGWAEEYLADGEQDIVAFFQRKIKKEKS